MPLGGQTVKHRQLAHQIGVRIEDPPVNSMASFRFTSVVLPEGTTLVFGSWVCIADGAGDFRRFTIDVMKPKTLAASFHNELNEFVDNLDDFLTHGSVMKIEEEFVVNATPPRAATTTLGSDSLQSEDLRSRSRLGLRNSATEFQEANNSESLSALEKDLTFYSKLENPKPLHVGHSRLLSASQIFLESIWPHLVQGGRLRRQNNLTKHNGRRAVVSYQGKPVHLLGDLPEIPHFVDREERII
jgi:hypothetical protein